MNDARTVLVGDLGDASRAWRTLAHDWGGGAEWNARFHAIADLLETTESLPAARCRSCGGAGWVLDCRPDEAPVLLELIPCLIPGCADSGRPVEHLSFGCGVSFGRAVIGPNGRVMAVAAAGGAAQPETAEKGET